jgi:indolepyruvate ferredoxin oxidoreductase
VAFLGSKLPAAEARELGLVNRVVGADELDATSGALLTQLAQSPTSALHVRKGAHQTADPPQDHRILVVQRRPLDVDRHVAVGQSGSSRSSTAAVRASSRWSRTRARNVIVVFLREWVDIESGAPASTQCDTRRWTDRSVSVRYLTMSSSRSQIHQEGCMVETRYALADRFVADDGNVFLSGMQALARVPIDQLRADRRAGRRTAAFISGYPGSPLGGFDTTMRGAARLVPDLPIVCRPAVNEEYAATAVMGSQLATTLPDRRYDGVLGVWYGKAPGVDRATDALRHAVYAGSSPEGGAVAFVGDDPIAKSSTLPSSSAGIISDLHIPMLYPADPAEVLDLGRHAVALSRTCGLWTALKIVSDVADGTASVALDPDRIRPVVPEMAEYARPGLPGGRLLAPRTIDLEREIYEVRYSIATAYSAANHLNEVMVDAPDAWLGIVVSGITYREVREALRRLGLSDDADVSALGIRLLRLRMPLPFDPATVRQFARGLEEVFVIEEKQPNVELLVKDALYSAAERPRVVGKFDERGMGLIKGFGALDADALVPALRARLGRVAVRLAPEVPSRTRITVAPMARTPYFCSGCPHNRSTTAVPDGALVGAGIGCHTMALLMDPDQVGEIIAVTCMGNEGTQWIGMAPFVDRDHMIQNLGDGTYFHSGQLAVTAAVAAGVNITYKLLYNGAVAMTGGQLPEGQRTVASVVKTLLSQGVAEVVVTTDDVTRYRHDPLPRGVKVLHRDRLLEAQEHLATVAGVTVLIHDQECAAELRRARKRGRAAVPTTRVAINHRVCEGCGDCGRASNCLSVQPFETPFGRATHIDQTTCNLDRSCVDGDCPSFVTVDTKPSRRRRRKRARARALARDEASGVGDLLERLLSTPLPPPERWADRDDVTVRMIGIGGTGVVTVAQVLGTAAMLDGFRTRGLDQTGLSQKAGPVVSDLHLTRSHDSASHRVGAGQADVLLVFDPLVAASPDGIGPSDPERTVVVGSSSITPPGIAITRPDTEIPSFETLESILRPLTSLEHRWWVDADALATRAFGDALTANVLVAGMAVQSGAIPVDPKRVEDAIELNGVSIDANTAAFRLGRHVVAHPELVDELATHAPLESPSVVLSPALRERIARLELPAGSHEQLGRLAAELVAYQDETYAAAYVDFVERVREREHSVAPETSALTDAVARGLYRLMAYKDEYEVARLLLDEDARRPIDEVAPGRVRYHLHPPLLRSLGLSHKIVLSDAFDPVFRALAKGKRLRGTRADPFGWSEVRRTERRLPDEYRTALVEILPHLDRESMTAAIALAELPELVRGYEGLKLQNVARFRDALEIGVREAVSGPRRATVPGATSISTTPTE